MHSEIQGLDFESQLLDDPGKWLRDLQFVEHFPKLEDLNISKCVNITDLKPLKFMKLKLKKCSQLQDISALLGMDSPHSVNLNKCINVPPNKIAALRANGVKVLI